MDLFDYNQSIGRPLADRMKPVSLSDFVGQDSIIGKNGVLRKMIENDNLSSIILHGPPGTGKTSIAMIIANTCNSNFVTINATTSGIKDIKEAIEGAVESRKFYGKKTILFIDEIHRFNKLQQDSLLPYVEKGDVILVGATTENPYFEVNSALISRSSVFKLNSLSDSDLVSIINTAITSDRGLKNLNVKLADGVLEEIIIASNGDARRALSILEMAVNQKKSLLGETYISLEDIVSTRKISFDNKGDSHYDLASAFIKSMRGSDANAAVHYLAKMIVQGEDPMFIARRIVICASEDVGNADPMALVLANSAMNATHFIGMPEARIILSQAAIYVANAPKSNSSYIAINSAIGDVENIDTGPMPYYLRDSTSIKMENKYEGKHFVNARGEENQRYKYPHDYKDSYVEQQYLPDKIKDKKYYTPKFKGEVNYEK